MSPFFEALEQGHSPEEILGYISKAIPKMAPAIKKATKSGYGVREILGFLSKNFDTENRSGMSESERHAANARSDAAMTKHGLKLGAAVVAAPYALSATRNALSRALPSSLRGAAPDILGTTMQSTGNEQIQSDTPLQPTPGSPQQPIPMQNSSSQSPIQEGTIPQTSTSIPEQGIPTDPEEYLKGKGVLDQVKTMLSAGNKPTDVAALLSAQSKEGRRLKGEVDPELAKAIEEYAKKPKPLEPEKTAEGTINPISKNATVITPSGIGEVKEIRNGQAIVEVDGKRHKVSEDELEAPQFSDDEVADAYDHYMATIPESEKSGFISWGGYNEQTNQIGYIPRGGKYEVLNDVTPEEAQKVKDGTGTARTSGETREGLWVMGEKTRGGVISQIIHNRKKEQKHREEAETGIPSYNPRSENGAKEKQGMQPIFDENSYGRNLSRKREEQAKLEEKEKKKKEKDEAKKRKAKR
jgi:hypothetical protein